MLIQPAARALILTVPVFSEVHITHIEGMLTNINALDMGLNGNYTFAEKEEIHKYLSDSYIQRSFDNRVPYSLRIKITAIVELATGPLTDAEVACCLIDVLRPSTSSYYYNMPNRRQLGVLEWIASRKAYMHWPCESRLTFLRECISLRDRNAMYDVKLGASNIVDEVYDDIIVKVMAEQPKGRTFSHYKYDIDEPIGADGSVWPRIQRQTFEVGQVQYDIFEDSESDDSDDETVVAYVDSDEEGEVDEDAMAEFDPRNLPYFVPGYFIRSNFKTQMTTLALCILRKAGDRTLARLNDVIRSDVGDFCKSRTLYRFTIVRPVGYSSDTHILSGMEGEVAVPCDDGAAYYEENPIRCIQDLVH